MTSKWKVLLGAGIVAAISLGAWGSARLNSGGEHGNVVNATAPATQSEKPESSGTADKPANEAFVRSLGKPTKQERSMEIEARRQMRLANKNMIAMARQEIMDGQRCTKGDAKACARMKAAPEQRQAQVAQAKESLAADCEKQAMSACIYRGDLEMMANELEASRTWYAKAREAAEAAKKECPEGGGRSAVCRRAASALKAVEKREARLAGETTH